MKTYSGIMERNKRRAPAGIAVACIGLVLVTGCESPNGTPNNTATGALVGGLFGATVGALSGGGRHAGQRALIGAAAGALAGGLIGHMIDRDQQRRLQQQSPQTWATIQHNDYVLQQQPSAPAQPPAAVPPPATDSPPSAAPPPAPAAQPGAPQGQSLTLIPLSVDDLKALTSAGVKPDVIIKEIESSKSIYSQQDLASAQQANPALDPSVLECMRNHSG